MKTHHNNNSSKPKEQIKEVSILTKEQAEVALKIMQQKADKVANGKIILK